MKKIGNLLWGVLFVALGVIIALNSLNITNINIFFDGWWTLFIIVPCFIGLFTDNDKTGNLIGLLIGVAILCAIKFDIDFRIIGKLILPSILIIIGLSILFKSLFKSKIDEKIKEINKSKDKEYFATFSSQNLKFDNENFEGASMEAVFGGIKLDLSDAIINEDVVIETSAIFGGIDIILPKNVNIKVSSTSIFGGVDNKNKTKYDENNKTIYIKANCVFGGVELK